MRQPFPDRRRSIAAAVLAATTILAPPAGSVHAASETTYRLSEYLRAALSSGPAAVQARIDQERILLQERLDGERKRPVLSAHGSAALQPNLEGRPEPNGAASPPGGEVGLTLSKRPSPVEAMAGSQGSAGAAGSAAAGTAGTAGGPASSEAWSLDLSVAWQAQSGPWQWDRRPAQLSVTYTRPLWPPVLADPTGFEARRVRAGQRQRQLTVDALQTFYGLQQAFAAYRTTWGRAALAQQRYEAAQALVEAGARGPADLLRAQDDLAQSRKELREAWRRTRDALVAFTSTAGLPLPGFAGATTPPAPEALGLELVDDLRWEGALRSLASLVGIEDGSRLDALTTWQSTGQEEALIQAWHSRALEAHPDVADARLAVQEAEVQLARARQAAGPSVQFSAGVVAGLEPGQRADPRLTMSLSQPLWAPALSPRVQEAAAALEAARQRLRSAEEQAIRELDQVWWDLGQAIAAADDARASLSRAEQTLQHALRREQRGLATPIDVEQASLAAEQARADVAAAGNQIRLQWLRLAAAMGIDPAWVLETRSR